MTNMPKHFFLLILFFVLASTLLSQPGKIKLLGTVYNSQTKETLSNCNILVLENSQGTVSDNDGNYSIQLIKGNYTLQFSYVGFETVRKSVVITGEKKEVRLDVQLDPKSLLEDEVTVTGEAEEAPTVKQKLKSKDTQLMPNVYNDVLRSVQVLAGVTTNNELSSGYNVRGGSFDENLIYLNGFEIYRPFLLKQGVEESQTLINHDMVSGIQFYNGGFPSRFGDRMSSALEVNYADSFPEKISGTIRVDLLNVGATLSGNHGNLNWKVGGRYAYPDAFLQKLQTTGDYSPAFSDIQLITTYQVSEKTKVEFLGLYAQNKFFLEPESWIGNFGGFYRGDYRRVRIDYDGRSEYKYLTALAGLRSTSFLNDNLKLSTSISIYNTEEIENRNITGDVFYNEDATDDNYENDEYLKTRYESADNSITLNSIRINSDVEYKFDNHILTTGVEYRLVDLKNKSDEFYYEEGEESVLQVPVTVLSDKKYDLNNFVFFLEDEIKFTPEFTGNVGVRFLHYGYSEENLISPRINLTYTLSPITTFTAGWGYYYQPPFINELKNPDIGQLKSQRAIHYTLGWNQKVKSNFTLSAELYYKDLDNLIPFYFDEIKMVYVDGNTREGYAYGLDLQLDGELIEGMRSIFGYSYLDTKERTKGTTDYKRRLLDQTHTLQIFLQDKIKKHPNWQSHLRFLFGSGLLYYNRVTRTDPETGNKFIEVDIENPQEYFLFFRVDMGLSASFDVFEEYKLIAVAEVLNVFDHLNYGSYDWVQALEQFEAPVKIPRVLSKRFFNIRVEFRF